MQKIVINKCYGGFGISKEACEHMGLTWDEYGHADSIARDDIRLIAAVEELQEIANGLDAELKVVEIPDGVKWEIDASDGMEWVAEMHRIWW